MLPDCNTPIRSILIGPKVHNDAVLVSGRDSREDAINAQELFELMQLSNTGHSISLAATSRTSGLILCDTSPIKRRIKCWHFRNLIAGYNGTGPRYAAETLSLFGFGEVDDLKQKLFQENQRAYYELTKPVAA